MAAERIAVFVRKAACNSQTQRGQNCESSPQAPYFVAGVRLCQNQRNQLARLN